MWTLQASHYSYITNLRLGYTVTYDGPATVLTEFQSAFENIRIVLQETT